MADLPKQYEPTDVESRWRKFWDQRQYFHADQGDAKAPYSITLPPPNVTGSLHMGHALGSTLQDVLIRWRRMQGRNSMWMPGTDHAGIATQMLVERDLMAREGKSKYDLGREKFLERVWAWKETHGGRIVDQEKTMGFSLDWDRARFTMDEVASRAVREFFVKLYEDGLIYRAHRLVNWSPALHTAVSDLEVDNIEENGHLWDLAYPVVGSEQRIIVATTRPETMLGDTAVAVHPEDDRYKDLVGKMVELPLTDRQIPIVADDYVDPEFGSGAVKITPAHDSNDFEIGQRHDLDLLQVIDRDAKMIAPAPEKYVGMTVEEARKAVVADLDAAGLLAGTKDYKVARSRCNRSGCVIEPLPSMQWYVKTEPLAKPAIEAVEQGKTKFVPELWSKTYMHWMTNIKDWCISRQLWWGHRIPAWYCDDCEEVMVSRQDPSSCTKCGKGNLAQDEDVLDTWFSSALWPFSTLGWPNENRSLATFYPNDTLVTGADIIFFWVARMMMAGLYCMGDVPFRTVYMTPIVTDEAGKKMSKTIGNSIDPLDVVHGASLDELLAVAEASGGKMAADKRAARIKKTFPKGIAAYGADALRFSLCAMTLPGRYMRLSMERVEGYRNFVNKLWNASRFALMNLEDYDATRYQQKHGKLESGRLSLPDRWILSRLQQTCAEVDAAFEAFRFSDAANALYHFVWHEVCDWYIELAKGKLYLADDADDAARERRTHSQATLVHVLEQALRMLHPIMPYVTEEIWHKLPLESGVPDSLMITVYPSADDSLRDEVAETEMGLVMEVVSAIRTIRSTYNVKPSQTIEARLRTANGDKRKVVEARRALIEATARVGLAVEESGEHVPQSAKTVVGSDVSIVIPLAGLVDIDAEKQRLAKEIGKTDKEISFIGKKLGNKKFVDRAPAEVVEKERARLVEEEARKARLSEALEALG
ncbi:MAG: valine--tRNA ligase [Deltaproteobacteria bacterium]|nr:valine--tRNA ligase [Deltaproteobacteria bacterium]